MTDDTVAGAARSAAITSPEFGPNLSAEVKAALHAREHSDQRPGQYDPLALAGFATGAASLIVSIAQLAQAILGDRRNRSAGSTRPDQGDNCHDHVGDCHPGPTTSRVSPEVVVGACQGP